MTTETDGRVAAHTPGPWKIGNGTKANIISLRTYDTVARCEVEFGGSVSVPETITANARLIAAAPDLLEALTMFVEYLDADDQDDTAKGIAKDIAETKARAAIAKATGATS